MKLSSSSMETPWPQRFFEARISGYEGSLEEYIELHKYARMVLAATSSLDDIRVTPSRVNNFTVRPLPSPSKSNEISIKDTFSISPQPKRLKSLSFSRQPSLSTITAVSSEKWLAQMRGRIEKELDKVKSVSSVFDERRQKQLELDQEIRKRRLAPVKPSLPADVATRISSALRKGEEDVLICKFNIDFMPRDLATLRSPKWLNDEVINFYMQLIQERSEDQAKQLPRVHVFSTFFYPKLKDRGYESVKTATRRINPSLLVSKDLILFPIHLGMHWCMAAIDLQHKKISYFDSLHGNNPVCIRALKEWLAGESKERLGKDFSFDGWQEETPKDIPAQQNGHDCGVFSLCYAEHLSRRAPFSFSQKDMLYYRDRISFEILNGRILE